MRFSLATVLVLGISVSGVSVCAAGQTTATYKVKHTAPQKPAKSGSVAPLGKNAGSGSDFATNAKNLQAIEHESAKSAAPTRSAAKGPKAGAAIKPVKDKPNPPINFNGASGKGSGMNNQAANPYKGRLKQKHSH